ncbi:hypothetical protein PAPYR_12132 [Paratrimastix pyriformis]|uniref:Uncharacterized protein n=1 Tax=Paratrimastix pyriformis TaxID=342808 RepID=A0ABQ8U2F0_9EUKA|nr:hypothetical protein PAPYR_12132 [Paratrimastix pyriformis]
MVLETLSPRIFAFDKICTTDFRPYDGPQEVDERRPSDSILLPGKEGLVKPGVRKPPSRGLGQVGGIISWWWGWSV